MPRIIFKGKWQYTGSCEKKEPRSQINKWHPGMSPSLLQQEIQKTLRF